MRNLSLDQAKVVLALMVVCIHSAFLKDFSGEINYYFVQSVFRIAVPIFFIISGFYFFSFLEKGGDFKKWAIRILIMHTIWSLVYLYFYIPFGEPPVQIFIEIAKRYVEGYLHLWFLMALLGGGILLMLLRRLDDQHLLAVSLIVFVCGALIQYCGSYHVFAGEYLDKLFNKTHIYRNFLFVGFPFLTLGYLIAKNKGWFLKRITLFMWSIFGGFLLIAEGFINLVFTPSLSENFDILFSLVVVSPFVFMLLVSSKRVTSSPIYSDISACIYFVHPLFIEIFSVYFQSKIIVTISTIVFSMFAYFLLSGLNKKYKCIF